MAQRLANIQVVVNTENRNFNHGCKDIDEALRYVRGLEGYLVNIVGANIIVNGIFMPDVDDDETFFYASVEAAQIGKVWVEEAHAFMSRTFKSSFEGGCFDIADLDSEYEGGWNKFVLDNIRADITGEKPVTCDHVGDEYGIARVYDKDVMQLCKDNGYGVTHIAPEGRLDDCGFPLEYWLIFQIGEDDEPDDDEIFARAAEEAAKEGKVWCEGIHNFVTPEWNCQFEADCFPWEPGEYEDVLLDNILIDIFYEDVTSANGYAVVHDADVANICRENGWEVVEVQNETWHVSEKWELTDDVDDDNDVDIIMHIQGMAADMKPIANSIYRQYERGNIDWAGFCNRPKFNMERAYDLLLVRETNGLTLYVTPIE